LYAVNTQDVITQSGSESCNMIGLEYALSNQNFTHVAHNAVSACLPCLEGVHLTSIKDARFFNRRSVSKAEALPAAAWQISR
jgi:hypothetical protein